MSDIPEYLNQKVMRDLNNQGYEMTPDEVLHHRDQAYKKIRAAIRAQGIEPPESDMELMDWLIRAGVFKK